MFKRLAQSEFGFARERRAKRMSEPLSQPFKYGSTRNYHTPNRVFFSPRFLARLLLLCKLCLQLNVSGDSPPPRFHAQMLRLCKLYKLPPVINLFKMSSALSAKRLKVRFAAKRMFELLNRLY